MDQGCTRQPGARHDAITVQSRIEVRAPVADVSESGCHGQLPGSDKH